jgi:hypothetical protein
MPVRVAFDWPPRAPDFVDEGPRTWLCVYPGYTAHGGVWISHEQGLHKPTLFDTVADAKAWLAAHHYQPPAWPPHRFSYEEIE